MSTACAPGKIILLGEHAVVYGRPALAVPVRQVQACATLELVDGGPPGGVYLDCPDLELSAWLHEIPGDHPLAAICAATLARLSAGDFSPVHLTLTSTIPVASGLGSSAAVSVAIARSLNRHFGGALGEEEISDLAFAVERIHHGTPSGIDNTVVAYDRPVFFRRGQPPEPLSIGGSFHFLIGDTGIAAPTAEAVGKVRERWQANPGSLEAMFDEIGQLVLEGRHALLLGLPEDLGPVLRRNHEQLRRLGVSSADLDRLVEAAGAAGALGAKMSGGGLGGNMIALVRPDQREAVAGAMKSAGATAVLSTEVSP
jgi:mevalonate kinase